MSCIERVHRFLSPEYSIPDYGKERNTTEALGAMVLVPVRNMFGLLIIKEKETCSFIQTMKKAGAVALLIIMTPIIFIGLLLRGIGSLLPHTTYGTDHGKAERDDISEGVGNTSAATIEFCYEQARILKEVCIQEKFVDDKNLPKFSMISGTALGAVRNQGIIWHDDDVDLMIFEQDLEAFLQLAPALKARGLELRLDQPGLYKLKFTKEALDGYRKEFAFEDKDVPELDIFVWDKMSDGSYTFSSSISRSTWPTEYMTGKEAEDERVEHPFGPAHKGLTLPAPNKKHLESYLKRHYGSNCLDYGVRTHQHRLVNFGCCKCRMLCFNMNSYYFKITKRTPALGCWNWMAAPREDQVVS